MTRLGGKKNLTLDCIIQQFSSGKLVEMSVQPKMSVMITKTLASYVLILTTKAAKFVVKIRQMRKMQ